MKPAIAVPEVQVVAGKRRGLILAAAVLASAWCLPALAQQSEPKRAQDRASDTQRQQLGQSELEKENLNYVAAAPALIKEVLIKDPGLLVELKRWIAREASDNGQVVSEEDLTDNAVFDRLTTDVAFRSIATRLVQRYGYLRPNFNPDSEMGKEQELLIKERVRRLVQIESQEDTESLKPQKTETSERKSAPCDLNESRDCAQEMPSRSRRTAPSSDENAPQKDLSPNYPNEGQPLNPSPRIMQTRGNPDASPFGQATDGNDSFLNVSDPMKQPGDPRSAGNAQSDPLSSALMDQARAAATQNSGTENSPDQTANSMTTKSDMIGETYSRRKSRLATDRTLAAGMPVHRPNPYADIPSLYDLYVQAPSTDRPPQRFGTEVFRDGLRDPRSIPMDLPVGPDYVVGPGDSLTIDLWGGISTKLMRIVDRQGRVTLPEAGPVLVSGRSLGEVQQAVQRAIATQYRDTSSDVSVSRLRTIRIYVVGEVEEPGAYDISSLSTALNALVGAGGVTPRGSLRSLKHMRGKQELEEIDAYDLLLHGVSPDAKKLENGDTLMVPPVGPQVTVTGMVRRPAIYELNGEATVEDALELAGGILPAAALRHVEVQRLEAHEKRTMLSLDLSPGNSAPAQLASFKIQEGDEIHIFPIAQYNQDTIYLQGHVQRPGRYSYHAQMKLTDLLASYKDILPEPAAHYGEIIRLNPPDFHPTVVSFDLAAAMADPSAAPALQPLDTVRIFSRFDFEPAPTVFVVGEVRSPGNYRTSGQASLRDAVFLAGGLKPDAALDTAQLFRINPDGSSKIFSVNLGSALNGTAEDNILLQPRDRLLIHKNTSRVEPSTIEITGEVAKPGRYPYTENMRAEDLIRAAGGLKRSADTSTADLTRYAASGGSSQHLQISLASLTNGNASEDLPLRSGDVLAIRQVPGWSDIGAAVKVNGEVMHPSTYGIRPGERLSSVLQRAGGYTGQAYPYGAVLMRREVREMETRNQMELINRMKAERAQLKALPEGNTQDEKNAKLTALAQTDSTITQLSTNPPIGRVVIHIQSDINRWKNTPADVALRDGDILMIPKKANVVTVNGQVFNPTAISAQSGRSAKWYLSQAGGLTPIADKKAVFVIRADGSVISAKNNGGGWFSGDPLSATLRPGDAVVVPEKPPKIGGVNWTAIMQTAQVASSVALAVAYIHP
ncbi:MAG TPA: SLBB domain-containing protein [Candidatus Sulfotelmatobacter sp.]|jgi:protein involved in polysaccharide export with SLBB domain|nr:SLBB domain-containing protein [Candidatus Sulfotelmatobacter sp.]